MAHCVFMHKADSIYDDIPAERYQFPAQYLGRAEPCIGDWIVYLEPSKVRNSRGYFAVAKVERIIPDPTAPGMFLALIEPGTYLDFIRAVPFSGPEGPIERGVLNEAGAISGRAQAAVRSLSSADFARIVRAGLPENDIVLPRVDDAEALDRVHDLQAPFHVERPIIERLIAKPERKAFFRRAVLQAYDETCAVTGWKLINGDSSCLRPQTPGAGHPPGLASAYRPARVRACGRLVADRTSASQRGGRQVNDRASVEAIVNKTGRALAPERVALRPHPAFLGWHREHCFKQ